MTLSGISDLYSGKNGNKFDPLEYHDVMVSIQSDSAASIIDRAGGSWFIRLGNHQLWPLMMGTVNTLQKRGYDADLDPSYLFMSGTRHQPRALPLFLTTDSLRGPADLPCVIGVGSIILGM